MPITNTNPPIPMTNPLKLFIVCESSSILLV